MPSENAPQREVHRAVADSHSPSRRDFVVGAAALTTASLLASCRVGRTHAPAVESADLVVRSARITTLDPRLPEVSALAVRGGRFVAIGSDAEVSRTVGPNTRVIDGGGRRVIPGLIDSHQHVIRGGLNYNLELRWEGVPSLADAMRLLAEQVARTPPGQWVRVVGGFSAAQFAEKRLPTIAELNALSPDVPIFILHLYDRALLNRAAVRAVGFTRDTPEPPGGLIERDPRGEPTGLLVANPNALILYRTLAQGPRLDPEAQMNSTRHYMRELNRLGVTGVCDAGGGGQNYPEDYAVFQELHRRGELTVRTAYNLFTQRPQHEREDFARWISSARMGQGDELLKLNGAGEMLVYSAADFEDFVVPRPDLPSSMESDLEGVVRLLAENGWAFRMHATYEETITRVLDVFERVDRDVPISGLRWFLDHCETISERSIERVRALGGGIAVQHRLAFQGEAFRDRYGDAATRRSPPVRAMLQAGVPLGAGTDATRVASYDPWICLSWLVSGRTVGGTRLYGKENLLSREEALRAFTTGSAWFSREEGVKGRIEVGMFADFAALSEDYFRVPEERIARIESHLTVLDGRIVHAADRFLEHAPPPLPVLPAWSPTAYRVDAGRSERAQAERAAPPLLARHVCTSPDPLGGIGGACACAF
jgi:predicted amidohydrolase YtcJ